MFNLKLGNLFVTLTATSTKFHSVITKAQAHIVTASKTIQRHARMMTMALTLPIIAFGVAAVKVFGNFDDAMTKSLAIMQGVSSSMRKAMEETAKSISRNSVTSAEDLAKAYYFLASAGLSAKQSIGALAVVEKFAVAGAFDMANATSLLADAQASLGMKTEDATQNTRGMIRISDVLVRANMLANASVEQFSKSLTTKAGASLRMLNKDVEEGVAVLAAYADQGIKGELAGEKLSIVLRDLQRSAIEFPNIWKKFGLAVYDASGKMLPMANIIRQIENRLAPMSDRAKKTTLSMLGFQERSVAAIQALVGTSGKIVEYERALRQAGGTTERVAQEQLKSFNSQMKIVWNNVKEAADLIGQTLAPFVEKLGEKIKNLTDRWRALDDATRDFIIKATAFVAAIGPALMVLSKVLSVSGMLIGVFGGLATALISGGLVSGLLTAAAAFGLIAAAVVGVIFVVSGSAGLKSVWSSAVTHAKGFFEKVKGFFSNFVMNMRIVTKWVQDNWRTLWYNAKLAFSWFADNMLVGFDWIRKNWKNVLSDMVGLVGLGIKNIINTMTVLFETMAKMYGAFAGWFILKTKQLFQSDFMKIMVQTWIKLQMFWFDAGVAIAKSLWDGMTGGKFTPATFWKNFVGEAVKGYKEEDLFGQLATITKDGVGKILDPIKGFKFKTMEGPQFKKFSEVPFGEIKGPQFIYDAVAKGAKEAEKAGGGVTEMLEEQTKATEDLTDATKKQQEQMESGFKQGRRVALFGTKQRDMFARQSGGGLLNNLALNAVRGGALKNKGLHGGMQSGGFTMKDVTSMGHESRIQNPQIDTTNNLLGNILKKLDNGGRLLEVKV
uniref:Putative tail protein n=1 Tax=viral metagenome TaxID=1070528 RepID=A0A6M3K668_9ZZZZ